MQNPIMRRWQVIYDALGAQTDADRARIRAAVFDSRKGHPLMPRAAVVSTIVPRRERAVLSYQGLLQNSMGLT